MACYELHGVTKLNGSRRCTMRSTRNEAHGVAKLRDPPGATKLMASYEAYGGDETHEGLQCDKFTKPMGTYETEGKLRYQ